MIALPYLSAIRFSGPDAGAFLHNQLSADVLALGNGKSTFACYCEPKGRVLALMLVGKIDEDYMVVLASDLAKSLSDRLRIYVMRSKVEINGLDDYSLLGVSDTDALNLGSSSITTIPVPGGNNLFAISKMTSGQDMNSSSSDTWKAAELNRGISWLSTDSSGQFLPQMLGFDQIGAVNFRKGCYPGQEIVARTHYLGKLKRHPRVLNAENRSAVSPLEKIQLLEGENRHDAIVVDSGFSEDQGSLIFVITRLAPEVEIDAIEINGEQTTVRQATEKKT